MQPRIIVISGTYGVGKTTLAHHLANKLTIYQRIGLGSISKTIKYMSPENPVVKDWGNYNDYKTEDELIKKLHRESELVCNILRTVIYNAFCTGESYVIDGVQLLPEYLPLDKINYIALELLDYTEHFNRFANPNKTKNSHSNNANFDTVRLYQHVICESAKRHNLPIFKSDITEIELANKIITDLNLK